MILGRELTVAAFRGVYADALKIAEAALGSTDQRWQVTSLDEEGVRFRWRWDADTEFLTWEEILSGVTLVESIRMEEQKRQDRYRKQQEANEVATLKRLKAKYPEEGA